MFSRETHYCGHIWIMDADGANQRQLTSGSDYDDGPIFTHTGDHIWFQRTPAGSSPGHYDAFTMTATGRKVEPIKALHAKWIRDVIISPQDKTVFYTVGNAQGKAEIWQMHPDGDKRHFVVSGAHPSISADGKQVAYLAGSYENEAWIMKPDCSRQHKVYGSKSTKRFVSFTPDGRQIAFLEELSQGVYISIVDNDGSHYRRLIDVLTPSPLLADEETD